jgi:hypothetical protein
LTDLGEVMRLNAKVLRTVVRTTPTQSDVKVLFVCTSPGRAAKPICSHFGMPFAQRSAL